MAGAAGLRRNQYFMPGARAASDVRLLPTGTQKALRAADSAGNHRPSRGLRRVSHPAAGQSPRRAGITTKKVRGNASDLKLVQESFRLVVEATGSPTGLALAQQIIEPRGTLVLKSTFHGAAPVETWPIVVKEITIVGSRCGPFAKAVALLCSGKIDTRPLITRTFPLAEAPAAIRLAQRPGVMKVLVNG